MSSASRTALVHPAFLGALGLLVLNDGLLKGARVLPSEVTGKLSDFAGLVVAPVVLAALLGLRSRPALVAAHVAVAIGFALTELSQSSADALASLLRAVGVSRAALVADPSDLWALVMLPLPYALLTREHGRPVRFAAPRVSLAVALLACVASPNPPPPGRNWSTQAFLVNGRSEAVDVRIAWTGALPDCAALRTPVAHQPPLERVVDPSVFDDGVTFHLEVGATVPIDETTARAAVGPRTALDAGMRSDAGRPLSGGPGSACQLVLLRTEGAPDQIVLVPAGPNFTVPATLTEPLFPERAVRLHDEGDAAAWMVGSGLTTAEAQPTDAPTTCTTDRTPIVFSDAHGRSGTLMALTEGVDGCIDAILGDPPTHLYVCGIPLAMFPFAVGDTIRVSGGATDQVVTGMGTDRLELFAPTPAPFAGDTVMVTPSSLEACNGERLPCGAFVQPMDFTLMPFEPGADAHGIVTHTDTTGTTSILVGTVEDVLLAMPGCEAGRDRPGAHAQAAVAHAAP